jgi:hypothetical protein
MLGDFLGFIAIFLQSASVSAAAPDRITVLPNS